jgi:hypothetical protein
LRELWIFSSRLSDGNITAMTSLAFMARPTAPLHHRFTTQPADPGRVPSERAVPERHDRPVTPDAVAGAR